MISIPAQQPGDERLPQQLATAIRTGTQGRVKVLDVSLNGRAIVIRGQADSFYAWQLAWAACQSSLQGRKDLDVECRLSVIRAEADQRPRATH